LRLLVIGTQGQLALSLLERGPAQQVEVIAVGRPDIDLARDADLSAVVAAARPDAVVNAAAYTAVDQAESEPDLAMAINGRGAGLVAAAAAAAGVPVVHISTDYVFDGTATRPYREDDPVAPLGVYGASKLAGEHAVAATTANHAILRTAWVYSPFGKNFVRTMLRLAETRDEVAVVADQRGCPNSALDLADGIIAVARNLVERPADADLRGIFNLTADGEASWAEFATEIFAISSAPGGPSARVRPIPTSDYPTPARRPAYSRLDGMKLATFHDVRLCDWRRSLDTTIKRLNKISRSN
jgi:dTDP-4-dehydrorhamnose reductase